MGGIDMFRLWAAIGLIFFWNCEAPLAQTVIPDVYTLQNTSGLTGPTIYLAGYYNSQDGGEGLFAYVWQCQVSPNSGGTYITGTLAAGSNVITSVGNVVGVENGYAISDSSGAGVIPSGTIVTAISRNPATNTNTLTISNASTASASTDNLTITTSDNSGTVIHDGATPHNCWQRLNFNGNVLQFGAKGDYYPNTPALPTANTQSFNRTETAAELAGISTITVGANATGSRFFLDQGFKLDPGLTLSCPMAPQGQAESVSGSPTGDYTIVPYTLIYPNGQTIKLNQSAEIGCNLESGIGTGIGDYGINVSCGGVTSTPACTPPQDVRDLLTNVAGFAGTGITCTGDKCKVLNSTIVGFDKGIYSSGNSDLDFSNLYVDANTCFDMNGVTVGIASLVNTHCYGLATRLLSFSFPEYQIEHIADNGAGLYQVTLANNVPQSGGCPTTSGNLICPQVGDTVWVTDPVTARSTEQRWTVQAVNYGANTTIDLKNSQSAATTISSATFTKGTTEIFNVCSGSPCVMPQSIAVGQVISGTGISANSIWVVATWPAQNIIFVNAPMPVSGSPASLTFTDSPITGPGFVEKDSEGSGYSAGDTLTFQGGSAIGGQMTQVKVLSVDGSGEVQTFSVTQNGSYTSYPDSPVSVTGGTGSGATFYAGGSLWMDSSQRTGDGYVFTNSNNVSVANCEVFEHYVGVHWGSGTQWPRMVNCGADQQNRLEDPYFAGLLIDDTMDDHTVPANASCAKGGAWTGGTIQGLYAGGYPGDPVTAPSACPTNASIDPNSIVAARLGGAGNNGNLGRLFDLETQSTHLIGTGSFMPGYSLIADAVTTAILSGTQTSHNTVYTQSPTATGETNISSTDVFQTGGHLPINAPVLGIGAAGTTQLGATILTSRLNRVDLSSTFGNGVALLPAASGLCQTIINNSTHGITIYGQGSDTINGAAGSTGISLAVDKTAQYCSPQAGQWFGGIFS